MEPVYASPILSGMQTLMPIRDIVTREYMLKRLELSLPSDQYLSLWQRCVVALGYLLELDSLVIQVALDNNGLRPGT